MDRSYCGEVLRRRMMATSWILFELLLFVIFTSLFRNIIWLIKWKLHRWVDLFLVRVQCIRTVTLTCLIVELLSFLYFLMLKICPDHNPKSIRDNNLKLYRWLDLIKKGALHKNDNFILHNILVIALQVATFHAKVLSRPYLVKYLWYQLGTS